MSEHLDDLVPRTEHDLSDEELLACARRFAARPDLWADQVNHDPAQRTYAELARNQHLDVWLICWSEDHDTGFHDHDLSAGAVAVVSGAVREERLVLGRPVDQPLARTVAAGDCFGFGAADIHRVLHAGDGPAVTIHVYSPPLARMGSYAIEPNGQLRRHAVPYETELRQLDVAARPSPPAPVGRAVAQRGRRYEFSWPRFGTGKVRRCLPNGGLLANRGRSRS